MRFLYTLTFSILLAAGCSPSERIANFQSSGCYKDSHGDTIYIDGVLFTYRSKGKPLHSRLTYKQDKIGNILATDPSIIFKIDQEFNVVAMKSDDIAALISVSNSNPLTLTVTDIYNGLQVNFVSSSC